MLRLPLPATDELQLADWLEFQALSSQDENASYTDLERVLRREAVVGPDNDENITAVIQATSWELEKRAIAADLAYPFALDNRSISLRGKLENFLPYIFCLCVSILDDDQLSKKPYPRRLFEQLSCEAAGNFTNGKVIRFGSPRQASDLPKKFQPAINKLCELLGEGREFRGNRTYSTKDDGVDVVAWRDFPDQAEGKLILLGNCASGRDWKSKLTELNPSSFCENWMMEVPVSLRSGLIRAFFVPRRIKSSDWKKNSRDAGIIFDRCRVAYWASVNGSLRDKEIIGRWTKQTVTSLAGSKKG